MIVVRIELWPGGREAEKREIGVARIANVGGTETVGDYDVRLLKSPEYAKNPGLWRRGRVEGFPRKRLGPWDLLYRALRATIGERNPEPANAIRRPRISAAGAEPPKKTGRLL